MRKDVGPRTVADEDRASKLRRSVGTGLTERASDRPHLGRADDPGPLPRTSHRPPNHLRRVLGLGQLDELRPARPGRRRHLQGVTRPLPSLASPLGGIDSPPALPTPAAITFSPNRPSCAASGLPVARGSPTTANSRRRARSATGQRPPKLLIRRARPTPQTSQWVPLPSRRCRLLRRE
jgi:hypothetical protein